MLFSAPIDPLAGIGKTKGLGEMNEMLHAFPISRLGVGQLRSFSFCPLSTLNGFHHPVSYSQYSSSLRVSNPSIMKCQGFTYWFNFLEVDYLSHPERVKNLIGVEDWVPWSLPPSLVRVTVSSCIKNLAFWSTWVGLDSLPVLVSSQKWFELLELFLVCG